MSNRSYSKPIDFSNSTVVLTGGAGGIGYQLARCFARSGANLILVDRREQELIKAVEEITKDFKNTKVYSRIVELEKSEERQKLFDWIKENHQATNILVNNAGIQQRFPFIEKSESKTSWIEREKEIQVNLCAPIHLCNLFIDHFLSMVGVTSAIINVTSDLAFVPMALLPVYSATKAAMHSFTMGLRLQLSSDTSSIHMYEIIPPPVQTNLGGHHPFGVLPDEFCQAVFEQLKRGKQEIAYQQSEKFRQLVSRDQVDEESVTLYTRAKTLNFLKSNFHIEV